MKIGFLLSSFYPATGGREVITFNLARELVKRGHRIHVFTSLKKGLPKEETVAGIHIHRTKTLFQYKYYLEFNPGWLKNVLKYRLDILHVQSFGFIMADIALLLEKSLHGTKVINTPHGPFMALEKYPFWQEILRKAYTALEFPVNRLYDAVIQVNPEQWRWMVKAGAKYNRIRLVPNSIPKEIFSKTSPKPFIEKYGFKGKMVISYIGRIQKYKGLDQVITVLPAITKKHNNVVFLIMGNDAGDAKRLLDLAEKKGVSKNVMFTGPVNDKEKVQGLSASEIFVLPSEWEAFGIGLLEAMARGNALISTKTEGGKFVVEEGVNGYLYDYKDTETLKKHLLKLIKEKKTRNLIIKNNLEKAKGYSTEKITDKLENVYKGLLEVKH